MANIPENLVTDRIEVNNSLTKYYSDRAENFMNQAASHADRAEDAYDETEDLIDGIKNKVNRLYDDIEDIEAISDNLTNINKVSDAITNINIAANDKTNIDTVAGNITNIDIVAENQTDINTVSHNINKVNTVADDMGKVSIIYNNISDVNTIADNIESVQNFVLAQDMVNQYKGLKTGNISTEVTVLPWIEEMAHSTFDTTKFTKVSNPIVTSDGIASGFSNSNYLTIPDLSSYIPAGSTNFEVSFAFTTGSIFTNWLLLMANRRSGTYIVQGLWGEINSYGDFAFRVGNGSTQQQFVTPLSANTFYIVKFIAKNNNYYLYVNNSLVSQDTITTSIGYGTDKSLAIGNFFDIYPFNGSIDLKQFSITVDGIPVFSGNKTGVDTIKPDDYTASNPSNITPDGILDQSLGAGYITVTDIGIDVNEPFKIQFPFTKIASASSGVSPWGNYENSFLWVYMNDGGIVPTIYLTNSDTQGFGTFASLSVGDSATFILEFDGNQTYTFSIARQDGTINSSTVTSQNKLSTMQTFFGREGTSIKADLNELKAWSNSDLVYQSCLKIPYTKSKTGSKIVNSIYRPRVNDMAEQFGYANYYTLSDSDFTLPQGELYGMFEHYVNTDFPKQKQKDSVMNWLMPDYANGLSVTSPTSSNKFTAPCDGIYVSLGYVPADMGSARLNINGADTAYGVNNGGGYYDTRDSITVFLSKGDVIYWTNGLTSFASTFYPLKGV